MRQTSRIPAIIAREHRPADLDTIHQKRHVAIVPIVFNLISPSCKHFRTFPMTIAFYNTIPLRLL